MTEPETEATVSQEVADAVQQQFGDNYLPNTSAIIPSVQTTYTISPIALPPTTKPMNAEPDREDNV